MGRVADRTNSSGSVAVPGWREVYMHLGSAAGSRLRGRNPQAIAVPLLPSYLLCSDQKSFEARLAFCSIITTGEPNVPSNDEWDSI